MSDFDHASAKRAASSAPPPAANLAELKRTLAALASAPPGCVPLRHHDRRSGARLGGKLRRRASLGWGRGEGPFQPADFVMRG